MNKIWIIIELNHWKKKKYLKYFLAFLALVQSDTS